MYVLWMRVCVCVNVTIEKTQSLIKINGMSSNEHYLIVNKYYIHIIRSSMTIN